jgi:flagellar hook-associated protein 3 FlgL
MIANKDVADYQVQQDSSIRIDGTEIQLQAGDTVHAVIAKINDADIAVKAKLDPVKNSLVLQTTNPHQLWLEDVGEATVLQDLGVLSGNGNAPPHNIASEARLTGGSTFDMLIHLRDQLYEGDVLDIGGSGLQGIDTALNNIINSMAELGARDERLEMVNKRMTAEIPKIIQQDSRAVDLDMAEAIMDLKMLEYTHKAALQTAGRILQPTLLDFLR